MNYRHWTTRELRTLQELREMGVERKSIAADLNRPFPSVKKAIERHRL